MKKPWESPFGENILYYCKDCEKFVDASKVGRKFVFKCPLCYTKNVAFGTKKSLVSFFHIDEKKKEREAKERAKADDKKDEKTEVKKEVKEEVKEEVKKEKK